MNIDRNKINDEINDLRGSLQLGIHECKDAITKDNSKSNIQTSFNVLLALIDNVFTKICLIFENMNERMTALTKKVVEVEEQLTIYKQGMDVLTHRQMQNDKSLLLRELFNKPRDIIKESVRKVHLPMNYLDNIYDKNFEQNLDKQNTFLSYSINQVAQQIGLTSSELVKYLQVKQQSNANFHLNDEIKEFAKRHITDENYNLLNLIAEQQLLVSFNEVEQKKLQTVFEKICQILNKSSCEEHQPRFNRNDHVQVLYDDGQLYWATLNLFDSKTNKWKVVYDCREYGSEWVIARRIFKR
ncbi:unnamed protein product [Rotaria sordida]|uniref:Uncharacterized protein n=1 Tax=Rotaria sordida TaxID=392033 RepID=A0A814PKU5_9BILA|nr:unnamed protein product [Rotaria sordida]CAF4035215.1 unnamed protein product [Rotaria sordida]